MLLAADLGGTNLRVEARVDGQTVLMRRYRHVRAFGALEPIITEFLGALPAPPEIACIAVAGRVDADGRNAFVTNLGWNLSASSLERLGVGRVALVNDFEAVALGLSSLASTEMISLDGTDVRDGDAVVLGPGTGLGVAFRLSTPSGYVARATESGHQEWPARTRTEWLVRRRIAEERAEGGLDSRDHVPRARVTFEDIVSGPGLVRVYEALCSIRAVPPEALPGSGTSRKGDGASAITEGARNGDSLCGETVGIFFNSLAVLASDLALQNLAGGVYIAGTIARLNKDLLLGSEFLSVFRDKRPHEQMMRETPVFVIDTDRELGLEGAVAVATSLLHGG